jgi:2-keto-4-pentenoate hydratase
MNQQNKHSEFAAQIRAAYAGTPIAPIRTQLAELDVDAAYAIQQENTAHWQAEGRRLVGSKIGLTSRAVQNQLGVDRPDFGVLFADMMVAEDEPVAAGRVLQPKIEAEVAFLLDRDVDVEAPTVIDVLRAVAYAMPALEIVGSRITNWDIGVVDTVADNASSGLFVLGGPIRRLDGLNLRALQMQMTRREEIVSKGTGAACLGNPLNAMAWLASELASRKRPLRAGDVVLSGALGPMVPVNSGDAFEANIAGSGDGVRPVRVAKTSPTTSVLEAVILALDMGVTIARDKKFLERLRAIAPSRIHGMSAGYRPIDEWGREHTDGLGALAFRCDIVPS